MPYLRILVLSVCAFAFLPGLKAEEQEELAAACRRQMLIIHEALMYYAAVNDGELPQQLGDLVGDYLAPEVLKCPAARDSGETSAGQEGLVNPSMFDGRLVGYKWELATEEVIKQNSRGNYNWFDYKRNQLQSIIGDKVPLIRCEQHTTKEKPHLRVNLPKSGKIYESELYWECLFVHILPYQYMTSDLIEFANQPLVNIMRERSAKATPQMIDLRPYSNALPEHPWLWGYWNQELDQFTANLDDGIFWVNDIGFDVSGLIQLNGERFGENWRDGFMRPYFPSKSKEMIVDATFSKIHILGGTVYLADFDDPIGFLDLISPQNEVLATIPWKYGSDVIDMFQSKRDDSIVNPRYKIAWKENSDRMGISRTAQLLHIVFENPIHDQVVAKIQFRAGKFKSSPFIVGMTLEP